MQQTPYLKDLVLLGGGHSHVAVLKHFGMKPLPGLRITLVTRDVHTPYSGMLPGFVAGHYSFDECHIDLAPLARFANARLIHAEARGLDTEQQLIRLPRRPPLRYDVLSINTGSRPAMLAVPGAEEHALPAKPIDLFLQRWQDIISRARSQATFRVVVVGGGAGGIELALATQYRLHNERRAAGGDPSGVVHTIVTASDVILPNHNATVRGMFRKVLDQRSIRCLCATPVTRVDANSVTLADGTRLAADVVLWVTEASPPHWLRTSGLALDERGFIQVDASLRSPSHTQVFAAGDVATVMGHPRPKAGVFAVRQGRPLAFNLGRALTGKPLRVFRPQRRFLSLISTGDRYAIASRGRWALAGRALWRWKDHIDRAFMARYSNLPEMTPPAPDIAAGLTDASTLAHLRAEPMRCGGCASKLGSGVLERVLQRLDIPPSPHAVLEPGRSDDAAVLALPTERLLVQSVDYFRSLIDDPYLFGRIAANHALGDLHAMGAEPHSALAIATLPQASEVLLEDQLYQLMAGALRTMNEQGAALIGGHSGEGTEMAFGLSVNGLAWRGRLLTKHGLQPGDALLLTKPLGTGTLFAAAMRGRARGRWLDAAVNQMLVSQRAATDCLQRFGATACTDVTGFGLLGHLLEMLQASRAGAALYLAAVPALDGALETLAQGVVSSLAPDNLRARRAVQADQSVRDDPRFLLLFDPQTAGGLLAAVPAEEAPACLQALQRSGYPLAAQVGYVEARGSPEIRLISG